MIRITVIRLNYIDVPPCWKDRAGPTWYRYAKTQSDAYSLLFRDGFDQTDAAANILQKVDSKGFRMQAAILPIGGELLTKNDPCNFEFKTFVLDRKLDSN